MWTPGLTRLVWACTSGAVIAGCPARPDPATPPLAASPAAAEPPAADSTEHTSPGPQPHAETPSTGTEVAEVSAREQPPADPHVASASADCTGIFTPEGDQRRAIVRALHAEVDPWLNGQASVYQISWLRSDGTFAFIVAHIVGKEKPIDWSRTTFAEEINEDLWDGPRMEALLWRTPKGWQVWEDPANREAGPAAVVGATDVWWDGLWDLSGAPVTLFPGVMGAECPPTEGSGR